MIRGADIIRDVACKKCGNRTYSIVRVEPTPHHVAFSVKCDHCTYPELLIFTHAELKKEADSAG